MIYKNAQVLDESFVFRKMDFKVQDGRIHRLAESLAGEGEDLSGKKIIPGLVDVHIHGREGKDFCGADKDAYSKISKSLAKVGVTSYLATSMTQPIGELEEIYRAIRGYVKEQKDGARLAGINMEGPYFSVKRKGAQDEASIKKPDIDEFMRLYHASGELIRIVNVAPEVDGATDFIQAASEVCTVSVAHTTAGYDIAKDAFRMGADHCGHLYNAMDEFAHREPSVAGAVLDSEDVYAEIICDGIHVHPAAVRIAYRLLGDRFVLISDNIKVAGLADGVYQIEGQTVTVNEGQARLPSGALAGSCGDLYSYVKNAFRFGIPFEQAVKAASWNAACSVHMQDQVGSLSKGKLADFLVLDNSLNIERVYIGGILQK